MIKRKKTTLFLIAALLLAIFYMQLQTSIPGFINDLDFNSKEAPKVSQLHPYVLQQKNELVRLTKKKESRSS